MSQLRGELRNSFQIVVDQLRSDSIPDPEDDEQINEVEREIIDVSGAGRAFRVDSARVAKVARAVLAFVKAGKDLYSAYLAGMEESVIYDAVNAVFSPDFSFPLRAPRYPVRRILIVGETGTGKEGLARVIGASLQALSDSRDFSSVNVAGFHKELVQSELFGHLRGSHSTAHKDRDGVIGSLDENGVLFLDEIGEAGEELQRNLLRFLESHTYRRLGGTAEEKRHVHVIAATGKSISELLSDPEFRTDLFYRLGSCVLELPPLRQLIADREIGRSLVKELIDLEVRELLDDPTGDVDFLQPGVLYTAIKRATERGYEWPGNLREMRSFIGALCIEGPERAEAIFDRMTRKGIHGRGGDLERLGGGMAADLPLDLKAARRKTEEVCFRKAIDQAGSMAEVGRLLGITRQTASRKMKEFGLEIQRT